MIRTLAFPLFVGYTTTLPPPHQRLSSDEQHGSWTTGCLVLVLDVFRLCTLLGQNPLSNSCCRGSYLLNTLMFIVFLWSRNTG